MMIKAKQVVSAAVVLALATVAARGQAAVADAGARQTVVLGEGWRFHKGDVADAGLPATADSGAGWENVTVPHTWNALDGQDGGNNYYKGDCWYRRQVTVTDAMKEKSLYLRFEGINRKAEIYVNGVLLGSHAGGEAAICLDATKALKAGENLLAVKVSNRVDQDMPPISGDFTFFGGMYRPVELVAVGSHHFSLSDFGSPGVYVTTPEITDAAAKIHVRALVQRDDLGNGWAVTASIKDATGKVVATASAEEANVPSQEVALDLAIPNPHRWNGRLDPYLYTMQVSTNLGLIKHLESSGPDMVTIPLGIRTMAVDPVKGFLLNGKPYNLHGVNRHQERQDKGWALSEADHLQDMALIKEMGCTAIRLAHYQHAQFFYDLCDKEGMVVWAEIPVIDRLATGANAEAFNKNAQQQYTELIRQNFNHPSIAFWSAGNEVDPPATPGREPNGDVFGWYGPMKELGHKEDPSRLTASAWREKFFPPAGTTDVLGLNEYVGWYTGGGPGNNSGWEDLEKYIATHSDPAKGDVKGMWGVTEYGAGSSIYFHSEKPIRMDHSEEYESLLHENTWKVLKQHPEIWGKFVWAMFDFASDGRAEGDHAGINDKGLVTHDRAVKKDAFYFYKAVWSPEPTLQITSKRFAVRGVEKIPVKVYTNAGKAVLTVNGVALAEKAADNGTIVWEEVALKEGKNEVRVTATGADGKVMEDTCTWTYMPGAPLEVYEGQDQRMKDALKAGPPRGR